MSDEGRLKCPFCQVVLRDDSEIHVLACSLAEICKQGPQIELAKRCERAYKAYTR